MPVELRNVFTVDVEEWFHICGVGGALAPRPLGSRCPSRVEPTTRSLLDLLDAPASAPRSSSSGWVAERHPRWSRTMLARRPRDRLARLRASARVYDLGPDAFRDDLRASVAALARRRSARDAVSRAGMVDQRAVAVGARRRSPRRASRSTPAWRRSRWSATSRYPRHPHRASRRAPGRFSRCRRSSPIGSAR